MELPSKVRKFRRWMLEQTAERQPA